MHTVHTSDEGTIVIAATFWYKPIHNVIIMTQGFLLYGRIPHCKPTWLMPVYTGSTHIDNDMGSAVHKYIRRFQVCQVSVTFKASQYKHIHRQPPQYCHGVQLESILSWS